MQKKRTSMKDFSLEQKLGEGAFGVVYRVRRLEDNKLYAIKKVKIGAMKEKEKENAVNEIRILASLNDQFVIGYKDAFYDEPSNTLCIVMEYAESGDLLKRIGSHLRSKTSFPEQEIWKALGDIVRGIKSLHDKKIMHRDLKCANIFVTKDGIYKLGDLNVSKVLKKGLAYTQTGTPYYASPEVWMDKPYNMKSDIWSLGCVIYEMAALKPPFQAVNLESLFKKIKLGKYERIPSMYSNDLANLIDSMLKVNPAERCGADDLISDPKLKKRLEGNYSTEEIDFRGELLQTIKFNPRDLRALRDKLPPANYYKAESKLPDIEPKRDMRERVFSACGIRNYSTQSTHSRHDEAKKPAETPKIPMKAPPLPPGVYRLPPRPQMNNEEKGSMVSGDRQRERERSKQNLRRIGYNILTGRSNSVHKDY